MKLAVYYHRHQFRFPFRIAHTVREFTECLYIKVSDGLSFGLGEAVYPPYVKESIAVAVDFFKGIEVPEITSIDVLNKFIARLHFEFPERAFSIAGLDNALHTYLSKKEQRSIAEFYNITGGAMSSSFTIGIGSRGEMDQKLKLFPDEKYYKLKVDQENIDRVVVDFVSLSGKPFVVDANQGFKDRKVALSWCDKLFDLGVAYLEQPFQKDNIDDHKWLKENTKLPILADESFQKIEDLKLIETAFDGVNVKLMKIGGVNNAQQILKIASGLGMSTVLGCMSESSVGISTAYQIAPLADWVDLDGSKLITNDVFLLENDKLINALKRVV